MKPKPITVRRMEEFALRVTRRGIDGRQVWRSALYRKFNMDRFEPEIWDLILDHIDTKIMLS